MPYRIAVCDDEEEQGRTAGEVISKWSRLSGHACQVRFYPSAEAFLFEYQEDRTCDILLLDIEMEGLSGIELAKRIRREDKRMEIIFLTSHFEFIGEGYEVDALHYLMKPVPEDKLMAVLSKAAERLAEEPLSVVILCEGETIRLYETDILYVEAFLHYISIHTRMGEYKIKESISAFSEKLSADFYRIHRSYLASLKHIRKISRTSVIMEDQKELPLARGKYDDINRAFIERN